MEYEQEQVQMNEEQPSYWMSVIIASLITALVVSILSFTGGYMTLGSEPSGSMFNSLQLFSTIGCLLGSVGGIFATWHYANEFDITFKVGKGALIGVLVAVAGTVFTLLIGWLWEIIDPSYTQAIMDWMVQNMEASQMPEQAKQQAIERIENFDSTRNMILQALGTLASLAVVNVISGMIGAKIFASEE